MMVIICYICSWAIRFAEVSLLICRRNWLPSMERCRIGLLFWRGGWGAWEKGLTRREGGEQRAGSWSFGGPDWGGAGVLNKISGLGAIHSYQSQLYQMNPPKRSKEDPFIIIRNHRKPATLPQHSKEHRRHQKDYSNLPQSIIMTRKMQAKRESELKVAEEEASRQEEVPEGGQQSGWEADRDFFFVNDLEKGIPVGEEEELVLLGQEEVSPLSNHTKLETILGIGYVGSQNDGWDGRL